MKSSVLLISGCQDNQLSQDSTFNGKLKTVWNGGTFRGSYRRFRHCDRRENHDADRNNEKEQIASFANGKFHRTYLSGPTAHLLARKAGDASRRNDALRQGASGMGWSYLLYAGYAYDPYA